MAILKSNLCPKCGGLLDIDLDKQIYICSFCGVSFDYEYFREDNVKEVASKAILRGEYGSAKDAYDFMLTKDPHDFESLRGLFLCRNHWPDMRQMQIESDVQVSPDDPVLLNAVDKCLPEHKPYFEKVREALKELRHYRDLKYEAKKIGEKKEEAEKALHDIQEEHYTITHLFTEFCNGVKEAGFKAIEAVIGLTVILPLYLIGYAIWQKDWDALIQIAVVAAVIIGVYFFIKLIAGKCLSASMVPHQKEVSELTEQYEAKNAEAKQADTRYMELVQEFMDMDPVPSK